MPQDPKEQEPLPHQLPHQERWPHRLPQQPKGQEQLPHQLPHQEQLPQRLPHHPKDISCHTKNGCHNSQRDRKQLPHQEQLPQRLPQHPKDRNGCQHQKTGTKQDRLPQHPNEQERLPQHHQDNRHRSAPEYQPTRNPSFHPGQLQVRLPDVFTDVTCLDRLNLSLRTNDDQPLIFSQKAEKRYRAWFSKAFIPQAACSTNAVVQFAISPRIFVLLRTICLLLLP